MNVNNGDMGTYEEMVKKYGEESIVPVPEKKVGPMSNWGRKKRERYAELLGLEKTQDEAFDIVENFRGVIQDES